MDAAARRRRRRIAWSCAIAAIALVPPARAAGPATQPSPPAAAAPSDPTTDWLFSQATTAPSAPATAPSATSQPASPFAPKGNAAADDRPGTITLSNGEKLRGAVSTTPETPIRVWDDQKQAYIDLPLRLIKSIDAKVLWERDEREWHFKESGSDVKEYTGKSYPARETAYAFTLVNGQTVTGGVAAPLYLDSPGGQKLFVLHKRDKGDVGQSLKDLVYVRHVDLDG